MPAILGGSIALNIFNSISPFPSNISGILSTIVDQNRFYVEQFTGATIGNSIAEQYQLPITNLATANVLKLMSVQDNGVQSVTVGDTQTNNNNLMEMAKQYQEMGDMQLKQLTRGLKYFKAYG